MLKVIIDFFTYLLAVYGILSLIINIADALHARKTAASKGTRLALIVRDQEQTVEGFIRSIFLNDHTRRFLPQGKLHVVDLDSTDATAEILKRLEKEYNIEIYAFDRREELFGKLND